MNRKGSTIPSTGKIPDDGSMDQFLFGAVAMVNLLAFLAFGWDKRRARREKQRVPESTLIWLAFATGLAGSWLAMAYFRHKTNKRSFKLKMILVTIVNPLWLMIYLRFFTS